MSASIRPTRWPCRCRARARLAATVDLPTPPLPEATATVWRTPGNTTRCGPGGCMRLISMPARAARGLAAGPWGAIDLAQRAQPLDRVDPGVVPVVPGDLVGV